MTPSVFNAQIQRLRVRFGERAFDPELTRLIAAEVQNMTDQHFQRFVDVAIGTRHQSRPPLITDFREAAVVEQNNQFKRDLRGATQVLKRAPGEMRAHLAQILSKEFGHVESVNDAREIARCRKLTGGNRE